LKIYKKLAGQTIIYGAGTIVPKILNYVILTAYYTRLFEPGQFGVITELYAYVTFLMIILTYGTETGFFKFAQGGNDDITFTSLLASLFCTSLTFVLLILSIKNQLAELLDYQGNEKYISILGIVVGIDAFSTIFFARLRKQEKSMKFSCLKIVNVLATIISVITFYELVPALQSKFNVLTDWNTRDDIIYVLYSNLIASAIVLALLIPELFRIKIRINFALLKDILIYSFPLLIAGLAGTINETLDRVLLKHMVSDPDKALYILGIYGANYRIAMILSIFIQMFRYAVEPFYFNYHGQKDEKLLFSGIMRLFIGVMIILIMVILFYMDYVKFFISENYHEGLKVIPVVLIAFLFYGIFFNQSVWYKLTRNTPYAILLTLLGASITVIANVFFVRRFSYMAAAYGHLFAYFSMMVVSFFLGRKYYVIDYNLKRIGEYFLTALIIFIFWYLFLKGKDLIKDILSAILILLYGVYILKRESLFKGILKNI
jgi:O-antigen/teichoic acid export membrane protein